MTKTIQIVKKFIAMRNKIQIVRKNTDFRKKIQSVRKFYGKTSPKVILFNILHITIVRFVIVYRLQ